MTQSTDLFTALLKLGSEWRISNVSFRASDSIVVIEVEHTDWLFTNHRCQKDGGKLVGYDRVPERVWRHLNVFEYKCEIRCRLPRGKCEECGSVAVMKAPWEGMLPGFSYAFESFALLLARSMSVAEASRVLGENDKRLWKLIDRQVEAARKELDMSQVRCVGADEMSRSKGHKYLTVFADMTTRRVLFATEGKDASTWTRFAGDLAEHKGDAAKVGVVSIDMSGAYRLGAKEACPNARVVFDKFHVVKLVNDGQDAVRRAEQRDGSAHAREQLKKSRWVFRKNVGNLTDRQWRKLNELDHENLVTSKAYQMRLGLQGIYAEGGTEAEGRLRLEKWCHWVCMTASAEPLLAPMARVARTLRECMDGIMAHWETGVTNAFMEGLNSVFSAVKRRARGFRTVKNLTNMLYFTASGLRLPVRPLPTH
jgi:transposase